LWLFQNWFVLIPYVFDLLANTRVCSFRNLVNSKYQSWMGIWFLLITVRSSYSRNSKNHPIVWKNRQCSGRLFDRFKKNWEPWFIYNCSLLTIVSSLSWVFWPVLVAKFGLTKMFKFDPVDPCLVLRKRIFICDV
jgi:hypothetical protein